MSCTGFLNGWQREKTLMKDFLPNYLAHCSCGKCLAVNNSISYQGWLRSPHITRTWGWFTGSTKITKNIHAFSLSAPLYQTSFILPLGHTMTSEDMGEGRGQAGFPCLLVHHRLSHKSLCNNPFVSFNTLGHMAAAATREVVSEEQN